MKTYPAVVLILLLPVLVAGCDSDESGEPDPPPGPTPGALDVSVVTSGRTLDADGYQLTVDGTQNQGVETNDTLLLTDLAEGDHAVELGGIAGNCGVTGNDNPRTIFVPAADTVSAVFEVECRLALRDKIVFQSERDGNNEIYVMDTEGGNPVNLTTHEASDRHPAVSPDGTMIAFSSTREGGDGDLFVMRADGSEPMNLTDEDPAYQSYPTWAPDGTRIAYVNDRNGNFEIYVMDADGSNATNLSRHPADDREPAWSPDGSRIAFASDRDGGTFDFEVYAMDPSDGTSPTLLTDTTASAESNIPAWSPDGTKIAFSNRSGQRTDIYVMEADGSNPVNLTSDLPDNLSNTNVSSINNMPAWSPDGTRLAFVRTVQLSPNEDSDIFTIDANGSTPVNLTFGAEGRDTRPAWSP